MADETYTKADLDKAVKDAIEEATKGLKQNLSDALDEAKEAKRKLRAASEIKPEDMAALETELDKVKGELATAQKAAKDANTAKEKAEKALADESTFTQKLLVQDGLKSQLIAAGVKDEDYLDTLSAKFAGQAKVEVDGDKRVVKLGDKPLDAAIKEWAGSDAGKKFIAAPANSGGGAPGGSKGGTGKGISQAEFDAMSPKDRAAHFADGGTITQPA